MEIKMEHQQESKTISNTNAQNKQNHSNNGVPEYQQWNITKSEFLTNLSKIPLIHTTFSMAMDLYGRAKESSRLVGGTLSFAETGVHLVQAVTSPFINRLTPIAGGPLSKVDNLANKGLESLERTVPVIKKQPQEIYTDTKGMLETRFQPTVERLNGVSNSLLGSSLAQFSFDIYEKVLFTTGHILNNVIPPAQNPEASRFPHDKAPEDKSSRGTWLAKESYFLFTSICARIFGLAQSRLDSAMHAAQNMKKTL